MTSRPVGQEGHCFLVVDIILITCNSCNFKNTQYCDAKLLNIHGELFEKSETLARFLCYQCSM